MFVNCRLVDPRGPIARTWSASQERETPNGAPSVCAARDRLGRSSVSGTAVPTTTTTSSTTTSTTTSSSTTTTVPGPATLAVAYSNLDGVAGYDASGSDVLIARLTDVNEDGVVSVGDRVELAQYPLDFGATAFGNFLSGPWPVVAVSAAESDRVVVATTVGIEDAWFGFEADADQEYYWDDQGPGSNCAAGVCNDIIDRTNTNTESIGVRTNAYSMPDTEVFLSQSPGNPADEAFLDIDILI